MKNHSQQWGHTEDIRLDPKVAETYWDMMGCEGYEHDRQNWYDIFEKCSKCGKVVVRGKFNDLCKIPDPIPLSPAELAEYMMRQCYAMDHFASFRQALYEIIGNNVDVLAATPQQRIDAAVKAWKVKS